jgi:hypothetical protein
LRRAPETSTDEREPANIQLVDEAAAPAALFAITAWLAAARSSTLIRRAGSASRTDPAGVSVLLRNSSPICEHVVTVTIFGMIYRRVRMPGLYT